MHVHLNVHWGPQYSLSPHCPASGLTIAVLRLCNVLNEDKVRDAHGKSSLADSSHIVLICFHFV